jgi:hypothetical protein
MDKNFIGYKSESPVNTRKIFYYYVLDSDTEYRIHFVSYSNRDHCWSFETAEERDYVYANILVLTGINYIKDFK